MKFFNSTIYSLIIEQCFEQNSIRWKTIWDTLKQDKKELRLKTKKPKKQINKSGKIEQDQKRIIINYQKQ